MGYIIILSFADAGILNRNYYAKKLCCAFAKAVSFELHLCKLDEVLKVLRPLTPRLLFSAFHEDSLRSIPYLCLYVYISKYPLIF